MYIGVHGISNTEKENLFLKTNDVAKTIQGPELVEGDVVALLRLPSKSDKVPCLIARVATWKTRETWVEN